MKKNKFRFGVLASFSVLMIVAGSGCGTSSTPPPVVSEGAPVLSAPELGHRWQQEKCDEPLGLALLGMSKQTTIEFSNGAIARTETYFSTSDCRDAAIHVTYHGQYFKRREFKLAGVYEIDLHYERVTVVGKSDAGIDILRTGPFCGHPDWRRDLEIDVTVQDRGLFCPFDLFPRKHFDIYLVEGNLIFFGKGKDKFSGDSRFVEVDRDDIYHQL